MILPPKMAGNGNVMLIFRKYSETVIQNCLKGFPSSKIMGDIHCQKNCGKIIKKNGGFITILPHKTAVNGSEMITAGKYS